MHNRISSPRTHPTVTRSCHGLRAEGKPGFSQMWTLHVEAAGRTYAFSEEMTNGCVYIL